jgi:hypothetical protein
MDQVFPAGCVLVPGSIAEAIDYDESGRSGQARDKLSGQPVWQCRVMDQDPALGSRSRETVVKIVADRMPVSPVGEQWLPVEFPGLTVTPYVDASRCKGNGSRCGARVAFSLRATGIKAAARPASQSGRDAA